MSTSRESDALLQRVKPGQLNERIQTSTTRPIHYSNVQLVLGNYDIQPKPAPDRPGVVEPGVATLGRRLEDADPATSLSRTVVATRLRAANVRWVGRRRAFVWDRVPVAVRALRPDGKAYEAWRIDVPTAPLGAKDLLVDPAAHAQGHIPWPRDQAEADAATDPSKVQALPLAGPFDTLPSAALRATWQPLDHAVDVEVERRPTADDPKATETVPIWRSAAHLYKYIPELQLPMFEFFNPAAVDRRRAREHMALRMAARREARRTPAGRLLDDFRQTARKGWLRAWRGRTRRGGRRSGHWSATTRQRSNERRTANHVASFELREAARAEAS